MSDTEYLRQSEALLLPEGFIHGHVFTLEKQGGATRVEVDGWHPETREAIEINQSQTTHTYPKPGQKRKIASDALKLIFLKEKDIISRGRIFITSEELYTWLHRSNSWLSQVCNHYNIGVELHAHDRKRTRKRIRNVIKNARKHS